MKFVLSFLFAAILIYSQALSQTQVKIMSYNLLNYPNTDTNIRNPYFRTVINSANPDILIVCEINFQTGVNDFLKNVMNYSGNVYSAGTFIDGYDTDNALFYKTSMFNFISNTKIPTLLRDINEFKIADKIYSDTLRIYALHLRAGDTSIVRRGAEIDSLRKRTNQLAAGTNFIVCGDFNIYGSTEPAYQKLIHINLTDDGYFNDPLSMTGVWNNSIYSPYHTQSTRTRSFGDGATGGLDDRFDMILYSNGVKNNGGIKFISGSYTSYGNDGNHYNDSINKIPNSAVTQTVANALHYASDHLPVYSVFEFGNATQVRIKTITEGLYNTSSDRLNRSDTIRVNFRKNVSPYSIADSFKTIMDSVTLYSSGISRKAKSGLYYIQINHRNSIETWSSAGGVFYTPGTDFEYDFTNQISKAYGNNLILKGSRYCIYSGDINQDGTVDATDLSLTENDAAAFVTGYAITDLNGDNITDASDSMITDNNASGFVSKITP